MKKKVFPQLGSLFLGALALVVIFASGATSYGQGASLKSIDITQIYQPLNERGAYTMVPRSSVIHIPKGLEHKFTRPTGSKLVDLSRFMRGSHVWLHKMPVTMAEAQGKVAIDPLRLERVFKLGKVVIAVHKGKAISIRKVEQLQIVRAEK